MKQSGYERKHDFFTDEYGQETVPTIQREKIIPDQENVRTIVDVARTKKRRDIFSRYIYHLKTDLSKVDEEKGESCSSAAFSDLESVEQ